MRKVSVNEDDLKKVILILELSRPHIKTMRNLPLRLDNLWRVSRKLSQKLLRVGEMELVETKQGLSVRVKEETES